MASLFSGTGYCVKCKIKQPMNNVLVTFTKNGKRKAQAPCGYCGTVISRMVGKNDAVVIKE